MISKDCTITIDKGNASVDEDVYLYKNDMNIQILFTIVNNKYRYTKNTAIDNIIANNKASYAQVKFKKGDIEIDFEEQETKDGAVVLLIKKELIDEDTELGDYSIQIRLFDENKTSVITLPPVENCIHIQRPLFEKAGEDTNIVDQALTDMAVVTYAEPISATNSDGTYNKKTWISKEKITTAELNRMEEGISDVSTQCKEIANNQPTDLSLDSATNLLQLVNSKGSKLGNGITLPISSGGGTSQYLHIKYSSTGAPQLAGQISDTPNAYIGLCVDTNADSPTNPKNYTWYNWKGDNGDTGATPNLQIGTVTTLESGSNATASITGTTENPVLNLGIPKGDKGDTGASGTGTGGDTETWEKVIETTFGEECYAFTVTQDKDGNPLQLKEGFIFLTVSQPKDTGSSLSYGMGFSNWESSFNGKTNIYNINLTKNYEFYRAAFYFKVINNYVFTQCLGNVRIGTTAPKYNVFTQPNVFNANTVSNFRVLTNSLEYVDKITVGLDMSTTGLFSADSIMEVWAKC